MLHTAYKGVAASLSAPCAEAWQKHMCRYGAQHMPYNDAWILFKLSPILTFCMQAVRSISGHRGEDKHLLGVLSGLV